MECANIKIQNGNAADVYEDYEGTLNYKWHIYICIYIYIYILYIYVYILLECTSKKSKSNQSQKQRESNWVWNISNSHKTMLSDDISYI